MAGQRFLAEPEAVVRLAALLRRQGEDAARCLRDPSGHREDRDGILADVWPVLDRWQDLGEVNTEWAALLATGSADDLASATGAGPLDDTVAERRDEYRPSDPDDAALERELLRAGEDVIAERARIMELTSRYGQALLDRDSTDEIARVVIGDWTALTTRAMDFAAVATTFDAIRATLDHGRAELRDRWAESPALAWLESYTAACGEHAEFLRRAGREVLRLTLGLYHHYTALSAALETAAETRSLVAPFEEVSTVVGEIPQVVHAFLDVADTVSGMADAVAARWPAEPYQPRAMP